MNSSGRLCAQAKGLKKRFGHVVALDSLSLDVRAGEVLGLIGPSGSGKTSFVKVLVGILTPDEGEASVFGERMPSRGVLSRVGYMAQADALYDDLSALDNLVYFATLEGMDRKTAKRRALELIDFVGLSGHERRRVREYSGGMRKRLSLAMALVHDPELFVLDSLPLASIRTSASAFGRNSRTSPRGERRLSPPRTSWTRLSAAIDSRSFSTGK